MMDNLINIIQEEIEGLAFRKVALDESIIKSKLLDSITVVDLAVAIEEKTGVYVPATDVNEENFDTINRIAVYLEKKMWPLF